MACKKYVLLLLLLLRYECNADYLLFSLIPGDHARYDSRYFPVFRFITTAHTQIAYESRPHRIRTLETGPLQLNSTKSRSYRAPVNPRGNLGRGAYLSASGLGARPANLGTVLAPGTRAQA